MTHSADMRRESGTCNVCAAPCSSCMHLNHALMGSKTDEFTDENCRLMEANQSPMGDGDVSSIRSRTCESLQHGISETSNMLSVNSSHDSLSENADSKQALSNSYHNSMCLEVLDDNTSCLSRASEANLVDGCDYRNADRINSSCRFTSVSHLGAEVSGSAPSVDMSNFSEIPSCNDVDADLNSPKVQSPCAHSQSGKSLLSIPSVVDLERDSSSHITKKLSECSLEFIDQSLTKEAAPTVVDGEKPLPDKHSLIDGTAKVSEKIHPNLEANTENGVGDATDETLKCIVSGKQHGPEELVESPEVDIKEHQSEDESDESDVLEHDVKVCDICGDTGREDLLAICSRCSDGAEHTYCMREMLQKVPEGDWLCEECNYAEATENQRLEETENQRLGKSEMMPVPEKDNEVRKLRKVGSTSQISAKRHSENIEITPAAKKQVVESITGSPKASSPKRLVSLSQESSFKSLDKGKVKPSNQLSFRGHSCGDDMDVAHSPSNGPQGQMPKGTLLKSYSFSTLNSKPRVKLVDEVVTQKQKGAGEHTSKNMETRARIISKSMSFKSTKLRCSSATESKVKMLSSKSTHALDMKGSRNAKEWGAVDRKILSRVDHSAVCSTMSTSGVSTPKGDQKLTPRSETNKPLSGNSRELKVNQDGKSNSLSKSTSIVGRKGVEVPNSSERKSIILGETLQDLQPISRETTNQAEKNKESSIDCTRLGVNTASESAFCPKCRSCGHSTECCTVDSTPETGVELSATRSSKEEVHKGNRLKAAINAALLRRPEICKKEVPNEIGGLSTSGTDLNCEAISQDQGLATSTPKNSISAEITLKAQENLKSSISETSGCSSINDVKQLNACPIDSCPQPEYSDSVGPVGKPLVRDLSNQALAISNALSIIPAIPEYDYIWQGVFEVHRSGKFPDLFAGIQAHLSTCASPKVLEVVNKFSSNLSLSEVPCTIAWPSQFNHGGAKEDNIALYFFAKDVESYEKHYKGLLDHMIRNDLALKAIFDGVELLVFPSNQLPEKSQRWNMFLFLWGVFRVRRTNTSDTAENICIPILNVMPVENDFSTTLMTLSETHCSPKQMDEDTINYDKISSVIPTSTSVDKSNVTLAGNSGIEETNLGLTHLGSQVNLVPQDSRFNTKSTLTLTLPTSGAKLCQEMKSTRSSLNGCLLEDGPNRESKISLEAIGTSAASKIMEAKTEHDISVEQRNSLSASKKLGAAEIIIKDKMSEKTNIDKDQERPKRKQKEDDRFIDKEAANEEDLTIEGVNFMKTTDENIRDPSDTVIQSSGVTYQRMPWNEVNNKLEDGDSFSKKVKTALGRIFCGRESINGSFTSFANDLGSCCSVEDKGCEDACDEKIIREDLGTMERTFFPVNAHSKNVLQLKEDRCPEKGPDEHEDQFRDGIPNLELALGDDTKKKRQKGMLPFFVGVVDKKNKQQGLTDEMNDEEEDGDAASLSLSLSFPSSKKECVKPVSKAEKLLPDGHRVNTSFLLFGSFTEK